MAFRLVTSQKALILQILSEDLSNEDAKACGGEISNNKGLYSLIMLDLSKVSVLDPVALKTLSDVGKKVISEKTCRLMVIANDSVTKKINAQGLAESLPCYVGVVPIPVGDETPAPPPEITTESLLKVVLPSIKENLRIYAKMTVNMGEPYVCKIADRPVIDLAGVGGFFCNHRKGNLILCFKKESYLRVVSSIMKKDYQAMEPAISDWSAELVNSILGRVKSDLRSLGYTFSAGIPSVFVGKDLEVFLTTRMPPQLDVVRCTGDFGEFFVKIMLTHAD